MGGTWILPPCLGASCPIATRLALGFGSAGWRLMCPHISYSPEHFNSRLTVFKSRVPSPSHFMAVSSLLSTFLPSSSYHLPVGCYQRRERCRLGIAISSNLSTNLGVRRKFSVRFSEFSGLKKMASVEGLQRRVRDPQLAAAEAKETARKTHSYVKAQISKPGVKSLLVFVAIPLILGSVNALFNNPSSKWFSDLKKPWWEPPGPIFGGAWSVLYPLMGLASWMVWADGGFHKQSSSLTLYVAQLLLNLLWPALFFGFKSLGLALVEIIILDGVVAATINSFESVNHVAANLMKPYLAWLLFATALNFNLWIQNRGGQAQPAQ